MIKRFWLLGAFALSLSCAVSAETKLSECSEAERDIEILSRQQPYYPHSAQMLCLTGWVKAEFVIDEQGRPRDVSVLESQPEAIFDRAAIEAIETWRFIPACREGKLSEREAVQTIEFQIQGTSDKACPDLSDLDAETVDLLGQIGARYALLMEFAREGGSREKLRAALGAPFDVPAGDMSRVAAFHREALMELISRRRTHDLEERFTETFTALMPYSLAEDPDLEQAREHLNRYREALEGSMGQYRQWADDLHAHYKLLERETDLEADRLELFVQPFLGNLEAPIDPEVQAQLQPIEDFQSLIEFLKTERGHWRVADNRIEFDDDEREEVWRLLWDQLIEHRTALEEQDRAMLRSFQDYSD